MTQLLGVLGSCGIALTTIALMASPVSGQVTEAGEDVRPSELPAGEASLRPGDLVAVSVWRRDELSGAFRVNADGTLDHPLYREVTVAGVALETAEERLRSYLRRLEADPQFAMRPFFRLSIGGEARSPGMYDLPPETSIAEAVAEAGGFTDRANGKVELLRGVQRSEMDLRDPRSPATRMPIRSGDRVVALRKSGFNFMSQVFLPLLSTASAVASIINLTR